MNGIIMEVVIGFDPAESPMYSIREEKHMSKRLTLALVALMDFASAKPRQNLV
ncbi:MAG: hypothetical protein V1755_10745 [Chloroflexota bacterium]